MQKEKMILSCKHEPKTRMLEFSENQTGDYQIFLCEQCHQQESKEFLKREVKLDEY